MDKRETTEEIADFLKFNQADIYALGESSPEVAEAFSSVILAIDKKYGSGMLTNKDIKPVSSSTQQTAKQTAKIRFKTLKELNEEYSGNYPKPGWPTEMDSRAGTELSPKELKAMIEAFKINGMFVVEFDTYDNTADFEVAPWMLTNKPLGSFGVYAKEFSDAAQQRQPSEAVGLTLFSKKQGFIKIDSVTPRRGAKSFVIKGKQNATDLPAELVAPNAVMNKLLAGETVSGYFIKELQSGQIGVPITQTPSSTTSFKVGDKVKIPTTKSAFGGIETSGVVKRAKINGLKYLVVSKLKDARTYALTEEGSLGGDYFDKSDLELYVDTSSSTPSSQMPLASNSKGLRPSPTQSATSVTEGTIMQGNDGNYYKSVRNRAGVQQWKKMDPGYAPPTKKENDYSTWTQLDLRKKRVEIEDAMIEYAGEDPNSKSDPEYQEMEAELDAIEVYIED